MKNTVLELAESVIHDSYVVSEDDAMDLYQSDAPEDPETCLLRFLSGTASESRFPKLAFSA